MPEKKLVDTRKGGDVNLAKYDQRLEDLGGQQGERMAQKGGKEKFRNNKGRQGGQVFSNKRRQDEAEKMRRLQLEIAKKAPVKVMIPDEISVGELASRMKKTGAEVVKRLMKNGIMASLSQMIDFDTASFVAEELGCKVEKEVVVTIEEKLIDTTEDRPEDLVPVLPWWWSWATLTTARLPCWIPSATPLWRPARPAASPSTSARIRRRSTASPSLSWIPRAMRRSPPCVPGAPW